MNSTKHLATAGAAAISLFAASAVDALTPEELFTQVSPSVWIVVARDKDNQLSGLGSAVSVGADRAVTNCHVLRRATAVSLRRERQTYVAQLEYPDPERDLCQLRAPGLPPAALAEIAATSTLRVGQKVYAIGTPRGLEQSLSDGLVSALRRNAIGDVEFIQITAPISPGSSGGGLFDEEGRLIGITSAAIGGTAQNLNFARPAQWIPDLPHRGAAAVVTFKNEERAASITSPSSSAGQSISLPSHAPVSQPAAVTSGALMARPAAQMPASSASNSSYIPEAPLPALWPAFPGDAQQPGKVGRAK